MPHKYKPKIYQDSKLKLDILLDTFTYNWIYFSLKLKKSINYVQKLEIMEKNWHVYIIWENANFIKVLKIITFVNIFVSQYNFKTSDLLELV